MAHYAKLYNKPVPQSEPLDDRQVKNNAGGFVYQIDKWARLDRFLILGSDSNTYYQTAPKLTRENAACVIACFDDNAIKTIDVIVSVSHEGRAPKNDAAIFALALGAAHSDQKVRHVALSALPAVCRTSTHLFQFVATVRALGRGWGRSLKRAVAKWYNDKSVSDIAYQMIKYRSREGWSHKDMLKVAHPDAALNSDDRDSRIALYQWARGIKHYHPKKLPAIIPAFELVQQPDLSKNDRLGLIRDYNLPWETLPTECNADPDYWAAQLPTIGLTALMRNLGNMSRIGLIKPLSAAEKLVAERLTDGEAIRKSRLHPFNILVAQRTYESGQGFRSSNTWPVSQVVASALEKAFYTSFKNVQPSGKRFLFGLDVSGSMSAKMNNSNVSCCEATAAMSLVSLNVEPQTHVVGFYKEVVDLGIRKGMSLAEATKRTQDRNFGSTDASAAMRYALEKGLDVDVFVVMTDNETWCGNIHPTEALREYRRRTKINAKLVVVGMTATNFSIADPRDLGMLDLVGFDTSAPAIMADFARK